MTTLASSINARPITFLKIELSGITLRFASENVQAKDTDLTAYFWEGRLLSISDLSCGFNDFKSASSTVASINISLANGKVSSSDSTLDSYLTGYFWGKKTITVYVSGGPSYDLSTSDIVFKGIVGFPDVYSQTESEISFSAYDSRYLDQLYVCPNVFQPGQIENDYTYSFLGMGVEGRRVPVVYGDFSGEEVIPCYLISNPSVTTQNFKIANYGTLASGQDALKSCTMLSIDGGRVPPTSAALSTGYVTLTNNALIETKAVWANCQGKTRGTDIASIFGGSASALLEHPIEIIYDLLVNRLATPSTLIDSSSFTSAQSANTDMRCRRWIGGEEALVDVINDLCFEFGFELYSMFGVFKIKQLTIAGTSELSVSQDLMKEGGYSVSIDPNRSYFNKFTLRFDQDPTDQSLRRATVLSVYPKIAQHGFTQDFALDLKWTYREVWAVQRFGLLASLLSQPLRQIGLTCTSSAWDIEPTDVFQLTFHVFNAQNMLTRSVTKNVTEASTSIVAWDLGASMRKNWAQDADTPPATYALCQSSTFGVWHGDLRIITGINDTMKVTAASTATVTIPSGNYATPASLASTIGSLLTASVGKTINVTYDANTRKFTLATQDASNFTIHWTDTPAIGRTFFGFDVSANDTGAATYTADYLSIFDYQTNEVATQWA